MTTAAAPDADALRTLVAEHGALLLYDGTCGFCDRAVQLVLDHDRRGTMRFATLAGPWGAAARAAHPALEGVASVVLVDAGGAHVKSEAALRVAAYLGGAWSLAGAARIVPRPLRDAAYDVVARVRHRIAGRLDACRLPDGPTRARFLG
ncbi:MAG: DCC1-like thiol-disulfide oxidoreductase family protein [Gemmatimonadales bacterium]|nr:DCC1-like thiol-disulfide oxidoreductase family protein [Gemmatimonadales bacterium]